MQHLSMSLQQTRPIKIVPLHGRRAAAKPEPLAKLTYRGGPLLDSVQAVGVFWGSAWSGAALKQTADQLTAFLRFIVASPYVDQLAEYSTKGHTIARGALAGTATVTHPEPGTQVTDEALQQMLEAQVKGKALPAPTPGTLYVTFTPPGVAVSAGQDRSCDVFCGYHDRSRAGLYYAVVPYPDCPGCLGGLAPIDALTSVCSHEIAEAITDPQPGSGWYDDANGEIGDICAWQNKKVGNFLVQLLWSNQAGACV